MLQQPPGRTLPDTGDLPQFGRAVAHLPPLAMEGNSKPMGFVTDQLHQVQNRRVMVERYRFVLLAVDIDNFFALGDRRQRLVDDLQRFERFGSGVQLESDFFI